MSTLLRRAAITACFMCGLAAASAAQVPLTEIAGRVTDTSGAVLVAVTVTAEGARGQQPMTTHTSRSGEYRLSPVAPGTYRLTFTLTGYRAVVRDAVAVDRGSAVTINVSLDAHTTLGETFTRDRLDDIPSARDPWAIMNQTPGVVMTGGVNVGGSGSGQQLSPDARGQGINNVTWTLDGAAVTDLVAIGGSPIYYDFGSFDSIHVTTGGGDASQQASGVAIRLTTRSGTNTTAGSARGLFSNTQFESSNITPALFAQGTGAGVPLRWYHEYGAEAGGPLVRNRMWWWAGSGVQDLNGTVLGFYQVTPGCPPAGATYAMLPQLQSCLEPDRTRLTTYSGNVRMRLSASQGLTISANWSDKTRNARQASSLTAIESTYRQTGSTPIVALRHSWTIGGRLVLNSQVNYTGQEFALGFQTPDLANTQVFVDLSTGATSRSLINAETIKRPSTDVRTDGTLALGHVLSGDHALKFGFGYRRSPTSTYYHTGGNVVARYNGNASSSAVLYRDGIIAVRYNMLSAYLQDSWTLGRLVLSAGARWDLQSDYAMPESVPANPLAPGLLPAATFPGAKPPVDYSDLAPRLSASYDITGKGTTVVSGSYGVYFGQGINLARAMSLTGPVTAVAPWVDSNHDRIVQANEIALGYATTASNYNVITGLTYPASGPVDPTLQNSRTREAVVSINRQLAPDLSISASYMNRVYDRYIWTPRIGDSSSNYVASTFTDSTSGLTETYYALNPSAYFDFTSSTTVTNQSGRRTNYHGLDLALRKQFGDRWMLNAALTLQSSIDHYPSGSYTDPTNIAMLDGRPSDVNMPRYLAKINGRVALPWGFGLAANVNVQDGPILDLVVNSPSRPFLGVTTVLVAPQGTTRYPSMTLVDAQIDRSVRLTRRSRLTLSVVAFNLLNVGTIYSQVNNQSLSTFGSVLAIVGPRVLRFGGTISF
jgi:hypothetical protein